MIIGMDFGTTNSGMAVYDGQQLRLVPLDPHNSNPYVTRTAMYITNDRSVYIGREAINTYYTQNLNRPFKLEQVRVGEIELTFAEIGTFVRDVYAERDVYAPGRLFVSFKMGLPSTHFLGTIIGAHYFFLEDLIAVYLYVTRKRAEAFLNTPLDTIVLGRPVRYSDDPAQNDLARERMLRAAFRAGYKTVYLQYEPIAAAYYYETTIDRPQNVLIFDFGGGTLDISIVRVGDPKTRAVLATGGIPIAGDVFDQKIVRAKLPPHFGEGDVYRAGRGELPIPSSYYEAFSNWQDLLSLQRPDQLEGLRRIEQNARRPLKIRALINLITSNAALKMFDIAEANKRLLSDSDRTTMVFDGKGFSVREVLTRAEFERLIRSDVRAIGERLDHVLADAGLNPDQIDQVIRTGGSSQIPLFIHLLEERFGAEKVRDLDAFSSVTSGLGVVAHQLEHGEVSLKAYHAHEQIGGEYLNRATQGGIAVVDLDLTKRLIDLKETENAAAELVVADSAAHTPVPPTSTPRVLLALDAAGKLLAVELPPLDAERKLSAMGISGLHTPLRVLPADARVVLMTSEFRCWVKPARELAAMLSAGLVFEQVEGFQADAFGTEQITAFADREALTAAEGVLFVTSGGYSRLLIGKPLLARLDQPVPYSFARLRGNPAALLNATHGHDLLLISTAGRAARIAAESLDSGDGRIFQIPTGGDLVGGFSIDAHEQSAELVLATSSGLAKRLLLPMIPRTEIATSGVKLMTQNGTSTAALLMPNTPLYALTTTRILALDPTTIPLSDPADSNAHKLFKPKKDERLLALFA